MADGPFLSFVYHFLLFLELYLLIFIILLQYFSNLNFNYQYIQLFAIFAHYAFR